MADPILSEPHRSNTDFFSDPLDSHPLWFKPALFLSPDFDSDAYISDLCTFVPFDTLRSELQSYLTSLNHDLIDLITSDYADFVNLSTKLVDVDSAVVRMLAPLVELREKIEQFRGAVQGSLVALTSGLKQRDTERRRRKRYREKEDREIQREGGERERREREEGERERRERMRRRGRSSFMWRGSFLIQYQNTPENLTGVSQTNGQNRFRHQNWVGV